MRSDEIHQRKTKTKMDPSVSRKIGGAPSVQHCLSLTHSGDRPRRGRGNSQRRKTKI